METASEHRGSRLVRARNRGWTEGGGTGGDAAIGRRRVSALDLTIPWDHLVSDNERHRRRGPSGRAYKVGKEAMRLVCLDQVRGERPRFPKGTKLALQARFHPPDRRRRDVTNLLKGMLDAMQGIVYADDFDLVDLSVQRVEMDREEPRVEITVSNAVVT